MNVNSIDGLVAFRIRIIGIPFARAGQDVALRGFYSLVYFGVHKCPLVLLARLEYSEVVGGSMIEVRGGIPRVAMLGHRLLE
jgi:hypothetical protein